jgi:hypothetical protein
MTDLAIMTAILYAARLQRRLPESEWERRRAIDDACCEAHAILDALTENEAASKVVPPEQPPPSPGNNTGVLAEAKATRRRG